MIEPLTIPELLATSCEDATAIFAPNRPVLTYKGLRAHCEKTIKKLNHLGIGREDRVAIVLPNGPEMATAFVSIAAGAIAAPFNPAYRLAEFDFYLSDLGVKALLVEQHSTSPAVEAAAAHNIPICEAVVDGSAPAGLFEIIPSQETTWRKPCPCSSIADPDAVALLLHTSGTTSRPKIVPLTHGNVCTSARNICKSLQLTPEDRCMNVMPLFHIHGLTAAILSILRVGASVFCTPGFDALRFFPWLEASRPTWYSAVPMMHQTILSRATHNPEIIDEANLRFIHSASASLPAQVMHQLEETFGTPVVEAYAMTEASHQVASNPLPPQQRKPGMVGLAAGPDVSISDEEGRLLGVGSVGEVVIRGTNVTHGYEDNPIANAESFTNGWFRTGDQGVMDEGGYLTITGRIKEIINRGGEKVSPREVDDVLMAHPAVEQAVTFSIPHDKLGEEVAAAIVLRMGVESTEHEIHAFAAKHLANFKVPRQVLFLDQLPKGATGKIQRIGLAKQLGVA